MRSNATRFDSDQPKRRRSCRYLSSSSAIRAVQIWMCERVARRADEGLDAQVLLERFEEQLDLPAVLVDARDGRRPEAEVVGQEDQALAVVGSDHCTRRNGWPGRVLVSASAARRSAIHSSATTPPRVGHGLRLDDVVGRPALHARDEKHAGAVNRANQAKSVYPRRELRWCRAETSAAAPPAGRGVCRR